MNEPTIRLEARPLDSGPVATRPPVAAPEVSAFVDRVRTRLSDLTDEEREELVGGLEADIAELVSDGGSVCELGDPRAYADELRAAAGMERRSHAAGASGGLLLGMRRKAHRRFGEALGALLDAARDGWLALVGTPGLRGGWEIVASLRPVWWVLRAWLAVEVLSLFVGYGGGRLDLVPAFGPPLAGTLLLVAAVAGSVQMGRGKVWPGRGHRGSPWSRVLLAGLNGFAVAVLSIIVSALPTWENVAIAFDDGYSAGSGGSDGGLVYRGQSVRNVFPYDAQGRPLTGVQLFDQEGRPLRVARTSEVDWDDHGRDRWAVTYPWMNGGRALYNVVPLAMRDQARDGRPASAWTSANPPALPQPPLAVVPPVALPAAEVAPDGTKRLADGATAAEGPSPVPTDGGSDTQADGGGEAGTRDSEKRESR